MYAPLSFWCIEPTAPDIAPPTRYTHVAVSDWQRQVLLKHSRSVSIVDLAGLACGVVLQ